MKAATLQELKQEMANLTQKEAIELCLRLARFKKENKELLTYLLLEAHYEEGYIKSIKQEIDEHFATINLSQLYFAKKSLRKIVRLINKYSRYSNSKETEIELRLHFCHSLKESDIPIERNQVILNLYHSQLKKIRSVLSTLEEDLQYDYLKALQPFETEAAGKKPWALFRRK